MSLKELGLKCKEIAGDGNCLFRSLADQVNGSDRTHFELRQNIVKYISENRHDYEPFITDETFEKYCNRMKKDSVFGGNVELVAFARMQKMNVVVHQANTPMWIIQGADALSEEGCVHVYYHGTDEEHYSSVRNIDGPEQGSPHVVLKFPQVPTTTTGKNIPPSSIEKMILGATSYAEQPPDLDEVRRLLKKYSGNANSVIEEVFQRMSLAIDSEQEETPLPTRSDGVDDKKQSDLAAAIGATDTSPKEVKSKDRNWTQQNATEGRKQSARERKEAAKRQQKENALSKKRNKAQLANPQKSTIVNSGLL
ncbi:hypothetical protein BJ742DRAFT_845581, partial [Cladochytrium replicatum]